MFAGCRGVSFSEFYVPILLVSEENGRLIKSLAGSLIRNVAPPRLYGLQNSERVPTYGLRVSFQRVLIIIVDIGIKHEYDGLFCCSGAMC